MTCYVKETFDLNKIMIYLIIKKTRFSLYKKKKPRYHSLYKQL